jgi:hypothetical protein
MAVDESGNTVCSVDFGVINEPVDVDPGSGSIMVNNTEGYYSLVLWKLNALGEYVWHKLIGGGAGSFSAVAMDAAGSLYVSSGFSGPINVAEESSPVTLVPFGERDVMFCKYTSVGALIWARTISAFSSTASAAVFSMDVKNGRLAIGGQFTESFDFNPDLQASQLTALGTGNIDGFVASYEASSGQFVSAYKLGDIMGYDAVQDVSIDDSGNLYAVGIGRGVIDFDPGPGQAMMNIGVNQAHYVAKWNDMGGLFYAYAYYTNYLIVNTLHVDANNLLYLGGLYYGGDMDIDPSSSTFSIQGTSGWFAKYDQEFTTDLESGLSGRPFGRLIVIVQPYQAIEVRLPETTEGGSISVFDATGRLIDHQDLQREQQSATMKMQDASAGVYLVSWKGRDGAVLSERFIYQHY